MINHLFSRTAFVIGKTVCYKIYLYIKCRMQSSEKLGKALAWNPVLDLISKNRQKAVEYESKK